MATPLEALQNRAGVLKNSLYSSPTAYAPNTAPSKADISKDTSLDATNKSIEDLKSKQIRSQWYGPTNVNNTEDTGGKSDGVFFGALKALQRPLNAIVGAGQYALGKGTESSLAANVNKAMKTGLTSGNVLQQLGTPRAVQVPLGFALDVMFDPVNWLTAGTEALIPRVGEGLVKGTLEGGVMDGLKAAGTGLTSNLEKKAVTASRFLPLGKFADLAPLKVAEEGKNLTLGDNWRNLLNKVGTKYDDGVSNLAGKAISGADKYDALTGSNVYSKLNKGVFNQPSGIIGSTAEDILRGNTKVPGLGFLNTEVAPETTRGDKIVDFFKYSTKNANDIADLRDKVIRLAKEKGAILTKSKDFANFESIDEFLKPGATISLKDKLNEGLDVAIRDADGILNPEYSMQAKVYDSMENAQKLLEMAGEDINIKRLTQAYKETPMGKTGVEWYDAALDKLKDVKIGDMIKTEAPKIEEVRNDAGELVKTWNSYTGVRDMKPFEKLLKANQAVISIFKTAKVPMNAASHVVANIGNFFMGAMMGLPVYKAEYLESLGRASMLVKGRLGAEGFREMFFSDANSLIEMADNNPTRFKQLTGMDPSELRGKLSTEEKIVGRVLRPESNAQEVMAVMRQGIEETEKGLAEGTLADMKNVANDAADLESKLPKVNKNTMKKELGRYKTPSEATAEALKEGPMKRFEEFGSFTASEISPNSHMDQLKQWLTKQAELHPNRPDIRAANMLVNSMPRWYEHIDQSYKIGTADYLTKVGLTEQELLTISRTIPMEQKDLLSPILKGGEKLYRLTPLKAAEVATETYMNYAAMPDFVRVMRAIPVVGAPFLSFPYAMAAKTAKTLINNPAIFNKVGFMINEMNASRTPEEKQAMEEKYNAYLKSPTVVKMMGMWNTDIKNLVPYFQMNMLNPSERSFTGNTLQGQIMQLSDNFPILQDPVGSVFKDYFLQPWLLSNTGEVSQGQFGQPIMPSYDEKGNKINPSLGTRAFYGGRALAESFVPGALSYGGLLNGPLDLPDGLINAIPSYGFRNLANATQGKSSIGAMTKEDAVRKTFRSLLGRTGLPAYTLDPTKTSTNN